MKGVRALLVFGTRPEAIKMAPVVRKCRESQGISALVCSTGQHREMLQWVIEYFNIEPDIELQLMMPNQSLSKFSAQCLEKLDEVVQQTDPDCLVAQGDTTSAMIAALCAFYRKIPFIHVEAGLRSRDLHAPWPEEMNRRVADMLASVWCAPTALAQRFLIEEGYPLNRIYLTGNTVVDALLETIQHERNNENEYYGKFPFARDGRFVLVTAHRRESFGHGLENICRALLELSSVFSDVSFVYPVHMNPNVQQTVKTFLSHQHNIVLMPPLNYQEFVWLLSKCLFVMTDSGGVQEEAPSLGKSVVIMRDNTERSEVLHLGLGYLAGTKCEKIVECASYLLSDRTRLNRDFSNGNPFGDGRAGERITKLISCRAWES